MPGATPTSRKAPAAPKPAAKPAPPRPAAPAPAPAKAQPKPAGPPAVRLGAKGAAPAAAGGDVAPGVLDIKGLTEFKPPEPFGSFLEARKTATVNVRFGELAQGPLAVKKAGKGKYRIKKQPLPLAHPAFSLVAQFAGGLTPALFVRVDDSKVIGEVGLADGEKFKNIAHYIQKAPEMLGLAGFTIGTLPTITNTIDGGNLHLGLKGVSIKLGSAFAGKFNFDVVDSTVSFDGTAAIVVKGLANGNLELKRAPSGLITGKAAIALGPSFKLFSGSVDVAWDGVSLVGIGKVGYKGEKFSGQVILQMMEKNQALALAQAKQAPPDAAPAPAPAAASKKPTKIEYAIFGEGSLGFQFTPWLSGTAQAIFDAKGNLTVIGELRPQKEFNLFNPPQKDYVKDLFKFEIHATYGLPPIADVYIFAGVGMDMFAKLGPARLFDIFIKGTYSTDPTVAKDFSIGGTFNLSAAAGARLRIEAGAGLEILGHDIKAGAGITGIAGIKAYANANPVVGYREKAAEGQDLKGEWFISGSLEMAAQPFLGLGGDLFIELETPWWSPLSDHKWTWPLFNKEWPLGDPIGLLISVEHVFGSGEFPKFDLKPIKEFKAENCVTELYKDNAKSGPGKAVEQKGQWAEKNTPAANPPPKKPQPGNLKPGKPSDAKAKPKKVPKTKGKPATPDARTKGGKSVKQLEEEKLKKTGGKGPTGKPAKGKAGKGEAAKKDDTRSVEQKRRDLHKAAQEAEHLLSNYSGSPDGATRELAAIQKRYGLGVLRIGRGAHGPVVHAEINPMEEIPIAMSVGAAVKALQRGASEVAVRNLADAKAVLQRAFPEAVEAKGPTALSAFPSAEQAELVKAFREARGTDLKFHIDVERINVAAIRAALTAELASVRKSLQVIERDLEGASRRYHKDDALGQAEIQRLQQKTQEARDKVRKFEDFDRQWTTKWEPQFRKLELESETFKSGTGTQKVSGVLQGHTTVKDNPKHRFIAHINVEGVRIKDGSEVKAVIFIV